MIARGVGVRVASAQLALLSGHLSGVTEVNLRVARTVPAPKATACNCKALPPSGDDRFCASRGCCRIRTCTTADRRAVKAAGTLLLPHGRQNVDIPVPRCASTERRHDCDKTAQAKAQPWRLTDMAP